MTSYRNEVNRLTREIADLQQKAAQERARASDERRRALSAQSSVTRTTSRSVTESKLRQAQRHGENAVRYDQRAAELDKRAAQKRQALSSAENNLDRALRSERQKQERDAKRRRDDDLRRLRELEDAHRAGQTVQPWRSRIVGPLAPTMLHDPHPPEPKGDRFEYDVCLSFAGEERSYVEMIAAGLEASGLRVFYDADKVVHLWGKDLAEHFDYVYRKASRYCVMFVSAAYAKKSWTRHERRSALARALEEEDEYILPARFDDTELEGLRPTVGFVDLREYAPEIVVEMIVEKVRPSEGTKTP